ncbi:hypothetical protein [Protaetiibacter mangrovi]|uniref:Uncharacterized protein n=1 Tax=Protaetiibacter mangrovi TaxID=2970926 RepID=A0ABT1ZGE0_9MICO|nr:hypothetical protein [Protaetiibacter mangrovi]MCS0499779.1 hypothetical protein [Protaetiibacter mangrovi]TPX03474.1 hypothetical protein FJ656_16980 [Schumannella luteola]
MSDTTRTVVEELLIEGLVDWVDPSWVYSTVSERTPLASFDDRRIHTMGVIVELLSAGLMVPGDVDELGVFRPWDVGAGDAVERIAERWSRDWPGTVPTPGAICWMSATPEGEMRAHELVARERA